jgi:hypothetical protein
MVNHPPQLDEALEVARVYPHAAADPDACQLAPLDEQVHLVPGQREVVGHLGDPHKALQALLAVPLDQRFTRIRRLLHARP